MTTTPSTTPNAASPVSGTEIVVMSIPSSVSVELLPPLEPIRSAIASEDADGGVRIGRDGAGAGPDGMPSAPMPPMASAVSPSRSGSTSASRSTPSANAASARSVSSALVTSSPSGTSPATARPASSAPRRPKTVISASVRSGIQPVSVPGCAAGAADASAPASAESGALPLSFRPSVSATSTALAVVTPPRSALAPDASAKPARST